MTKKSRAKASATESSAQSQQSEPAAPEPTPKKPAPALYDVVIDGGNAGGAAIASLSELAALAQSRLVDDKQREVTLRVRARLTQGALGAVRADGVQEPPSRAERKT